MLSLYKPVGYLAVFHLVPGSNLLNPELLKKPQFRSPPSVGYILNLKAKTSINKFRLKRIAYFKGSIENSLF